MSNKYHKVNTPDADEAPPPAYQEIPSVNPNYDNQSQTLLFSPNHYHQHNAEASHQSIYPQIPSPLPQQQQLQYPQPQTQTQLQPQSQTQQQQQQHYVRYQTIEIPYTETVRINEQMRQRRLMNESRRFPLAAIFFLFGWFCPPLWIIGACCCAASNNQYESFWGKVNFIMAMALIISSIIFSVIVIPDYLS
ncbi:MAG: hypothetical protein EXX96DRAFT_561132 [Benjaminiella poitrasii]|nr:MAG: hypothetical protein EXX96DRAFT_561132 [Benjaminiella poitrasii]